MADFDKDDADLRKLLKKQGAYSRLDRLAQEDGLKALVATYKGRKYFWWLLSMTGAVGQNPFGADPVQTAFNCGMQNAGQKILANLLEVAPEAYLLMMKESNDERSNRNAGSEDSGDTPDGADATYT